MSGAVTDIPVLVEWKFNVPIAIVHNIHILLVEGFAKVHDLEVASFGNAYVAFIWRFRSDQGDVELLQKAMKLLIEFSEVAKALDVSVSAVSVRPVKP